MSLVRRDRRVLSGQLKFAPPEKPLVTKKKPLCTGNRCAKITATLATILATLIQLRVFTENTLPQSSPQTMTNQELWDKMHAVSNVSRALRKELEELKKAFEKEKEDKKALVQAHNRQGVMGAVKKGISDFFGNRQEI